MIPIELLEIRHNLADRDWDYCPTYTMDKNEADKVIKAIDGLKTRNKGEWIQTDKNTLTYHCSNCGFYNPRTKLINYCEQCGARMEGDEE